jgi:hypothetical protein
MLTQFLYISTAPSLSRAAVEEIVETCAQNNPSRGITGLLLYNGRNFLQLLEGEADDVAALMALISVDPRHMGVSVLNRQEIAVRTCPDWAMKRVVIAESVANRRETLDRELPSGLEESVRKMILNFAMLN